MSQKQKSRGSELKRAQFRRIALRTGHVQSLSSGAFEKVRSKALSFLEELVKKTVTYMEHARRITVSSGDVKDALRNMKEGGDMVPKIYGSPPKTRCETYEKHVSSRRKKAGKSRKMSRSRRSSSLSRQIRFYQSRQISCVHLARAPVERLIKSIARDFRSGIRLSDKATSLIVYALELYIEKQLKLAGLLSIHRKGKGNLSERDIETLTVFEKAFLGSSFEGHQRY